MADEVEVNLKKAAYIHGLRLLFMKTRLAGLFAVALGVTLVLVYQFMTTQPLVLWSGYGLLAAGWLILIYVVIQRSRWARAHPFDPNA